MSGAQHDHPHAHEHSHSHPHPHPGAGAPPESAAEHEARELAQLGPTDPGSVVMDIGGDVGSLMILAPADLAGAEIEISPVGQDDARTHIAIRERRAPAGLRWAGIFPGLRAGRYTVWNLDGQAAAVVDVVGGEVAQVDWS